MEAHSDRPPPALEEALDRPEGAEGLDRPPGPWPGGRAGRAAGPGADVLTGGWLGHARTR